MGAAVTFSEDDSLRVEGLPATLSGVLYDASYVVYGGVYTEEERGVPYSVAQENDVTLEESAPMVHWSNGQWASELDGLESDLFAITGNGQGELWSVGAQGIILKRPSGGNWVQVSSPVEANLRSVSLSDNGNLVAVGDGGTILEMDGGTWSSVASPTEKDLRDVWIGEDGEGWAAGWHVVLRRIDGVWERVEEAPNLDYHALMVQPTGELLLGTDLGRVVSLVGGEWGIESTPASGRITGFWGDTTQWIFAVTSGGRALVRHENEWNLLPELPEDVVLTSVAGVVQGGQASLWVGGKGGRVLFYDSGVWSSRAIGGQLSVEGLWVDGSGTDVIVVGREGFDLGPFVSIPLLEVTGGDGGAPYLIELESPGSEIPAFRFAQIIAQGSYPIWTWMVNGDSTAFQLPDLSSLAGWTLLSDLGPLELRLYSVRDPGFDIDQYNNFALNLLDWKSWSLIQATLTGQGSD
jgi:hypothetical protein